MTDIACKFFDPPPSEESPPYSTPEHAAWNEFYNTEKKDTPYHLAKAIEMLRLCELHGVKQKS